MKLKSVRKFEEQKDVLRNSGKALDAELYWVFNETTSQGKWENTTILNNIKINQEFNKTYGHYHGTSITETYEVVYGKGILILQKPLIENGVTNFSKIQNVYLIKVNTQQEIVISPEYGHSWSNVGDTPLILLDDWRAGHSERDYEQMKNFNGMATYLIEESGEIKTEKNSNYEDVPDPIWLNVEEFSKLF